MVRINKTISFFILLAVVFLISVVSASAGNKRIMTITAAKVLAERGLIESVYGMKVRSTEEVENMVAAKFVGKTETKAKAFMKGIKFEEVLYDPEKDLAKVTASVRLESITNIDGKTVNLGNKVFKRVAFSTSTPSLAGPLKALRAAEVDAYKQLAKRIVGFTLESHTTINNYILTSDEVKVKVLATCYLADVSDFGWNESGDAYVKMSLNISEVSNMLGEKVIGEEGVLEVEGQGAQEDDFSVAQEN